MRAMLKLSGILLAVVVLLAAPRSLPAEARIESNVVYGMYSGLALLMDIHYPANSNGYGVIVILGSAWHRPLSLDARPLKQSEDIRLFIGSDVLLESGYTLFSINHRAAPTFHYPAAVEDAQRAVRFVRHNAARYGIDPARIGAIGHSSGGHLVNMLGVLNGDATSEDPSPVNQESAKVQAVVALSAPADLLEFVTGEIGVSAAVTSFMGAFYYGRRNTQWKELSLYAEASPTSHVSTDDPPFLLLHGDEDSTVPFSQSQTFERALTRAGITVEFIRVPAGDHVLANASGAKASDHFDAIVGWFDRHLPNVP